MRDSTHVARLLIVACVSCFGGCDVDEDWERQSAEEEPSTEDRAPLAVEPLRVDFGITSVGSTSQTSVTLTNVTDQPLVVNRISLLGSPDFELVDGLEDGMLLLAEHGEQGHAATVSDVYRPRDEGRDSGVLQLDAVDSGGTVLSTFIDLEGNPD